MARRVFFSFHYQKDCWRAGQVRNSWVTKSDRETAGFFDHAEWEQVKRRSDEIIEKWIDQQLQGSTVTVVLIGRETYGRKWINYEITSSWNKGNGLIGIYVHNVKDQNQKTDQIGRNPFEQWIFKNSEGVVKQIKVYDWVTNNGRDNLGAWIEEAAQQVGR